MLLKKEHTKFKSKNYTLTEEKIIEYIFQRFQYVKYSNKIKNLVEFQTMNKYMIMAHDQEKQKKLGSIVSNYKKISQSDMLEEYEKQLKIALIKKPTVKTHTNVVMHIFSHFSKYLSQNEKQIFFELLDQFSKNKLSIGSVLLQITPVIFKFNSVYLARQTYFLLYSDVKNGILFNSINKKNDADKSIDDHNLIKNEIT